jgi:metal-responsive CopG/Arc/MetJ family transcriptional regulator
MRTVIDLGETQVEALDRLARQQHRSRASIIREAVDEYLDRHRQAHEDEAFGLWCDRAVDRLEFQDKVRSEW